MRSVDDALAMLNDGTIFNAKELLTLQSPALTRLGLALGRSP